MLRLFDTAVGDLVDIVPMHPGRFSMYVCGPTVYDLAHLGHGRYSLVFDVLRRYLEWRGLEVRHVSNITDVDDKILDRARAENRSPGEVAAEFEEKWFSTMSRLGVLRPQLTPHATAYIEEMVRLIGSLLALGHGYVGDDGVYFDISKVADYGLLSRQSITSLRAGARVEARGFKRSPMDFALWKFSNGDIWGWDSPWGRGRPGWHTECVVMSVDLLGEEFDLHGGGMDLAFPHHENERAQARAMHYGFSRHWMHNGFVMVGEDKMSKSLGNFTTLDELLENTDPRAYRLLVLQSHYRSPLEINSQTLAEASRALARLDNTRRRIGEIGVGLEGLSIDAAATDEFVRFMDNDLDTPSAIAKLFELRGRVNQLLDVGDTDAAAVLFVTLEGLLAAMGVILNGGDDDSPVPDEIKDLLARRAEARKRKDFALSDRLRDELLSRGYRVEDTRDGQKSLKI